MDSIIITRDYRQALMAFAAKLNLDVSELNLHAITPYDIELHQPLSATTTSYQATLKDGSGKPWERRLASGEIFFCYGIAIQVTKYDPASSTTIDRPYFSYPDPNFFSATNESRALELIWNGDFELQNNTTSRIQNFKCQHFRYVPRTGYAGTPAVPTGLNQYGPSFEERGFFLNATYPVFDGSETNTVKLTLGTGTGAAIVGSAGALQNQLVIKMAGFKYTGPINPGSCNA